MKRHGFVVWHNDSIPLTSEAVTTIGGKALGLHELKKIYAGVPLWATITTDFFKGVCKKDQQLQELFAKEYKEPQEKATTIRDYLKNIALGSEDTACLNEVWQKLSASGDNSIAVRSSAADEDSKILSFAGQMDSFLNIRTFGEFLNAVRGCWASLFGDRAVLYRTQHGINPWEAQIAVVAQQMIEADVAGVIFTANPLNGNREEMLITSTWGLGEGLVSGNLDADTYVLDKRGKVIKVEYAQKKQKVVYGKKGGTCYVEIEESKQKEASLNDRQLKKLRNIALKAQESKGLPLDIEFTIAEEWIYLLQARPVTTLKEAKKDNFNVWDNSNIVESYSGVTTPLTFSFIRKAYYAVYCQFCETIGVDKKTIFKNRHVFENMLGLIKGRVYYNLLNWYRLVSLMPGFQYNKRFMEQMMGLQVTKDFDLGQKPKGILEKYFIQLPRLLKVGFQMFVAHMTLQKRVAEFHEHFNQIYSQYSQLDYTTMVPSQILSVYRILEDRVLWEWKAPITNDFEAMIFYGLLKSFTLKWGLDPQGTLQNDLLCGEGGIKSTEVTTQLFYIAQAIEADEKLKSRLLEVPPEEALFLITNDPAFSEVAKEFNEYLQKYGVCCINEMKLESISIKDNPLFCISTIQNYLRAGVPDPKKQEKHERSIRQKAEETLRNKIKNKRVFLVIPKLSIYRWVLRNTRQAIKNRENQRFARTEAYSLIRTLIRAIGKQWHDKGIINKLEDIFYLEMEEIWSYIEGTSTCVNLKELISVRRKEFEAYELSTPDDHIETYGEVYSGNTFKKEIEIIQGDFLKGLGCCPGIVEKRVQVVLKPDSSLKLNGEIMVAKQTDPGWIILFPSVSGLIIEKGSMLSHSAIVAREMGIPTVVGVKNATQVLSSGDKVVLNGAEGTVKILQRGVQK